MLTGKTVIIAVTGSIAAYKMADCARELTKMHADVHVLMTQNATQFINPITFETLTQNKCLIDTFDRNFQYSVEHVALAKAADIVLIAPASANVIGKIANGIADDMLTTTVMACTCKKLVAPAMNHNMLHNPIVADNIRKLADYGYGIISPERGMLANRDIGDGKLPDVSTLIEHILLEIAKPHDMEGLKVLCTAGGTIEPIDAVRYITNHSTGKMGIALARAAAMRGAEVTLVAGRCTEPLPKYVKTVNVGSAEEMFEAVTAAARDSDIIVKAAAVADYTPAEYSDCKTKKSDGDMSIQLKRTKDIISYLAANRPENRRQIICGFSMETENLLENSRDKLVRKGLDMICANSLRTQGAGFGTDTNVITLITRDGTEELEKMTKLQAADKIFDRLLAVMRKG
jgi:phosphopantothenoylcysteine decarboxylase/phosphopantothenate--cysteine ligase